MQMQLRGKKTQHLFARNAVALDIQCRAINANAHLPIGQ